MPRRGVVVLKRLQDSEAKAEKTVEKKVSILAGGRRRS